MGITYVYMRHVYPRISSEECDDFFKKMCETPDRLFYLIITWWDYLIYLDTSIYPRIINQYKGLFLKNLDF